MTHSGFLFACTVRQVSYLALRSFKDVLRAEIVAPEHNNERVVAQLTDRPGIAPLLLLHDQEHAASILKAIRPTGRKLRQQPPPKLLTQPQLRI